jgi:hypothetical protein
LVAIRQQLRAESRTEIRARGEPGERQRADHKPPRKAHQREERCEREDDEVDRRHGVDVRVMLSAGKP